MLTKISLGLGAIILAVTAGSLVLPQRAEAYVCKATKIPAGYYPTGAVCGNTACRGEVFANRYGSTLCVILEGQP